jgi:hypothetical protein
MHLTKNYWKKYVKGATPPDTQLIQPQPLNGRPRTKLSNSNTGKQARMLSNCKTIALNAEKPVAEA